LHDRGEEEEEEEAEEEEEVCWSVRRQSPHGFRILPSGAASSSSSLERKQAHMAEEYADDDVSNQFFRFRTASRAEKE
jgi:hypothetical protein